MESRVIQEWVQRCRLPLIIVAIVSLVVAMTTVISPGKAGAVNAEVSAGQKLLQNRALYGYGSDDVISGRNSGIIYDNYQVNGSNVGTIQLPVQLAELVPNAERVAVARGQLDTPFSQANPLWDIDPNRIFINGVIKTGNQIDSEGIPHLFVYCIEPGAAPLGTDPTEWISNQMIVGDPGQSSSYSPGSSRVIHYIQNSQETTKQQSKTNAFNYQPGSEVSKKITWLLRASFPYRDLSEVNEAVGTNLNEDSAVKATQAAVWYFSSGLKDRKSVV